jgi:hypothetical protein
MLNKSPGEPGRLMGLVLQGLVLQGLVCKAWFARLGLQGLVCNAWFARFGLKASDPVWIRRIRIPSD